MDETRLAIVTGGGRGIGRAVSIELAAAGFHVVINYRANQAAAEETLGRIAAAGGQGEIVPFDVSDEAATRAALAGVFKRHRRVDVLVNNAGVAADGLFAMMPDKDWRQVLGTTLDGFYHVTRPVLMRMIARRSGSIVTISSISGTLGNRGQVNYSAAKAGVIGASRSLAAEVAGFGIRVNVVAPGVIDTDMIRGLPLDDVLKLIPMGRVGRPEEVARVVRFLCSEDASYVTGQVLCVSGGLGGAC